MGRKGVLEQEQAKECVGGGSHESGIQAAARVAAARAQAMHGHSLRRTRVRRVGTANAPPAYAPTHCPCTCIAHAQAPQRA